MILDRAVDKILTTSDLGIENIQESLHALCKSSIDYGDLYFQHSMRESWFIEDGIVKGGGFGIDQGVGVRALSGEITGFAYSDEISALAIKQAVQAAGSIAKRGKDGRAKILTPVKAKPLYPPVNAIASLEREQKIKLLQDLDRYARASCQELIRFSASLGCGFSTVLVAATDGTLAADVRPSVNLNVSIVVSRNGRTESAGHGCGLRSTCDFLFEKVGGSDKSQTKAFACVDEAIRRALISLESKDTPAGVYPVVLSPGWSGVLIHEAVGHGLEGDSCRKELSVYSKMLGQKVASPLCTIVDDGTIAGSMGSISIDDEGTASRYNVLIENGTLKGFMYDRHNAALMGKESTGNGRRQSYSTVPIPRMTNTYMLPGSSDPDEIVSSVKKGIYAANLGGGQVNPISGQFVFQVCEAYMIENGKLGAPLKGATLIGDVFDVMGKVSMVGNDLKFDQGNGSCGKGGQWIRVGIGMPTVRLDGITVGGTK